MDSGSYDLFFRSACMICTLELAFQPPSRFLRGLLHKDVAPFENEKFVPLLVKIVFNKLNKTLSERHTSSLPFSLSTYTAHPMKCSHFKDNKKLVHFLYLSTRFHNPSKINSKYKI